jgi:hypothetical protein
MPKWRSRDFHGKGAFIMNNWLLVSALGKREEARQKAHRFEVHFFGEEVAMFLCCVIIICQYDV